MISMMHAPATPAARSPQGLRQRHGRPAGQWSAVVWNDSVFLAEGTPVCYPPPRARRSRPELYKSILYHTTSCVWRSVKYLKSYLIL